MSTTSILFLIAYLAITWWLKKRKEQMARQGGTQKPESGHADNDEDEDDVEVEADAPSETSRTRVMKGKPFLMSGEASETDENGPSLDRSEVPQRSEHRESPNRDEHRRTTRQAPDWERGEHESPAPVRPKTGKEILDKLAKELGLPKPAETAPAKTTATSGYQPPKWKQTEESRRSSRDEGRRRPVTPASVETAAKASEPMVRLLQADDAAQAVVLQTVLGDPPGMRHWRASRRRPVHSPTAPQARPAEGSALHPPQT